MRRLLQHYLGTRGYSGYNIFKAINVDFNVQDRFYSLRPKVELSSKGYYSSIHQATPEQGPSPGSTNSTSRMPFKVLNVAEKNDAAKNISELLSRGRSTRKEGLSVYNKIYQFQTQRRSRSLELLIP